MRASAPHLREKQLLEIIHQFDDEEDKERIDAYKRTIARLQYRLQTKEDPYAIRRVIATILKSYRKRLEEALETSTSTPSSSNDENADDYGQSII